MANLMSVYIAVFLLFIPVVLSVTVETDIGNIEGIVEAAFNGKNVEAFLGIPYAKPPVGDLRFAHPQPYGSLGDFKATQFGSRCMTPNVYAHLFKDFPESEDCLFLNIYRPSGVSKSSALPVLVVIHGGAFTFGHAAELWVRGQSLVSEGDMIVVAMNYRLGVFGFADMGDIAPGNLGFFDQKLALEWVRDNIEDFGGNPSEVTLMGVSAGSMSVFAHIISPMTRDENLFQSAILDAGVLGEGSVMPSEEMIKRAKIAAQSVNCPTDGTEMLDCLRQADAKELMAKSFDPDYSFIFTFMPTLDGKFLPKNLLTDFQTNMNKYMNIPIIIGYADNEGSMFVRNTEQTYMRATESDPDVESQDAFKKWCGVLSNSFKYNFDFNDEQTASKLIDLYYKPYDNKLQGASDFIADGTFICPINAFLAEYSKHNDKVYFYKFDRVFKQNYGFDPQVLGAFHFSPFLHFMGAFLPLGDKVDVDDKQFFIDSMQLIDDFVHDEPLKFRGVNWPSFSDKGQLLQINETPVIIDKPSHVDNCNVMHTHFFVQTQDRKLEL